MNFSTPSTLARSYFYLFFATICLVGLIPATTIISSSHSLPSAAETGRSQQFNIVGASYPSAGASFLNNVTQSLLRTPESKIAAAVIADTAGGDSASVVILLADQADVSAAYDMKDQDARGWFVYNTLTQHAARTQVGLKAFLESQDAAYQSFWAANMIVATADRTLVEQLAERSDVARVDSNRPARWIEDPKITDLRNAPSSADAPNAVELGVTSVNAPAVWAQGFTGQGMVVGGLDTGIRWTHNALKPKYRGWNGSVADHNYNWHDAIHSGGGICGANTVAPCDDNFHGSHTVGTMVGDDGAGNQIGVAPGAKWIGCRNMDQGNGTPATY
ncbi:MAG TPA: S8 family serine peptidase, partial [Pyrinomonadaceae bacterium]|nr:S8 family serine peptidase [Pyrinomonadaceae bacterium]